MKIIVVENEKEFADMAFNEMAEVVKSNSHAVLGLATGSTPIPLYNAMIDDHKKNNTSYKDITTFNLDEYVGLSALHNQSYIYFMRSNLFDKLDINLKNVNIPNGQAKDIEAECKRYSASLAKTTVDIQVLGIGGNGHIAFNEPGTSFDSLTHVVNLTKKTIADNARFFEKVEDVPKQALTTGIGEIMRAKKILMLATGANKADAIYNMAKGKISTDCPASVLQMHSNVVVIVDKAAASKLN
ncbi:MAG: glucosamine-6-phosphate deaminase [Clostridia bacterium]